MYNSYQIQFLLEVFTCVSIAGRSKRNRSKSWDPKVFPPSKRGSHLGTSVSHPRAQTTASIGAGTGGPRRDRDEFRKALVNLIM